MSIKLAFSTNAYTRFSLDEAVRRIAGHGYRGVEILGDQPHAYPGTFGRRDAASLRKLLASLDLEVSNFNANTSFGFWRDAPPEPFFEPSLVSEDRELRAARREECEKAFDLLFHRTVLVRRVEPNSTLRERSLSLVRYDLGCARS